MKDFLYILPFKDRKHFKIGISSNNHSRILHLNKLYDIDLEKSFIVHSKKRNISLLEIELLTIFKQDDVDEFDKDGYTEIRNMKYMDECLNIIQNKHVNLNYIVEKLSIDLKDYVVKIKKEKVVKTKLKEIAPTVYDSFIYDLGLLYDNAYNIMRYKYDEAIFFKFNIDVVDFHKKKTSYNFHLTNDTPIFTEHFGLGCNKMVQDLKNNETRLDIRFPHYVEATSFTYCCLEYEYNDETKLLIEMFKKVCETIYYNQEFDTQIPFESCLESYIKYLDNKLLTLQEEINVYSGVVTTDEDVDKEIKQMKKWIKT